MSVFCSLVAGLIQAAVLNVSLTADPSSVRRGQHVTFVCAYNLSGAPLYSVKFYRGNHEFYRYSPSELPTSKVFHFAGFHVDVSTFLNCVCFFLIFLLDDGFGEKIEQTNSLNEMFDVSGRSRSQPASLLPHACIYFFFAGNVYFTFASHLFLLYCQCHKLCVWFSVPVAESVVFHLIFRIWYLFHLENSIFGLIWFSTASPRPVCAVHSVLRNGYLSPNSLCHV